MKLKTIAFLVPAYNEERVLAKTLESLIAVAPKKDIYVIDDGSTDNTAAIARIYTNNVRTVKNGGGKANALNTGMKLFKLVDKYHYIMPVDADTVIDPHFVEKALPILQKDKKKKIACVIGRVVGNSNKWLPSYRLWEYEIAQTVHKKAQSILNAVIVCPGPSTVFRSEIFKKVQFPSDTITEDMDLTFLIHRKNLGKIIFCSQAKVYTQDPQTIKDFIKQVDRWYMGFWQCVFKHNVPWGEQMLDLEVAFLATEGLFNGVLSISLLVLVPISLLKGSLVFAYPLIIDIALFLLPSLIYTAYRNKSWKIFLYIPHFYFLRLFTSILFLRSFFKVIIYNTLLFSHKWDTNRYETRKEDKWVLSVQPAARRS